MSLSYQSHFLDIHDGKHSLVDCFLLNESMMVGLWRVSFNSWKKFIKAIEDFFRFGRIYKNYALLSRILPCARVFRGGYENIQIVLYCSNFRAVCELFFRFVIEECFWFNSIIMNDTEYKHIALILYLHFWKVHQICMICKDFYLLQFSVFFGIDVLLVKMRLREMLQYKFDIFTTS